MKLLFLAAEPNVGALPRALAALGHEVRLAAPLAGAATGRAAKGRVVTQVAVPTVHGPQVADVYAARPGGVVVYRIAAPRRKRPRSDRAGGETTLTAAEQSIFFSLAAVALCRALDWTPEVLHALDPTFGAAIYWLATDGWRDDTLGEIATVLSVEEVQTPFVGAGRALSHYGLAPTDAPHLPDAARDALYGLGLAHADGIATTSQGNVLHLARLICGGNFAHLQFGWQGRMKGMLPGIDWDEWDPAHDPALVRRYDAARLDRRAANKRALQKELGLSAQADAPLFALLAEDESPASLALALTALTAWLASGAPAQVAVVGPHPPAVAAALKALARAYPGQVAATRRRAAGLVRRVLAGTDVFVLAGSDAANHENVRRALRYGAVPLAHSVNDPPEGLVGQEYRSAATAFVFRDYNPAALLDTLRQAQQRYKQRTGRYAGWPALQQRGMREAIRWGVAETAQAHVALYQHALHVRKEKRAQLAGVLEEFPASG